MQWLHHGKFQNRGTECGLFLTKVGWPNFHSIKTKTYQFMSCLCVYEKLFSEYIWTSKRRNSLKLFQICFGFNLKLKVQEKMAQSMLSLLATFSCTWLAIWLKWIIVSLKVWCYIANSIAQFFHFDWTSHWSTTGEFPQKKKSVLHFHHVGNWWRKHKKQKGKNSKKFCLVGNKNVEKRAFFNWQNDKNAQK